MKRLVFVIALLLDLLLMVSCSNVGNHNGILSSSDSTEIETRMHRRIISIDTTGFRRIDYGILDMLLNKENRQICEGMIIGLDYNLDKKGFAIVHFEPDAKYECPADCAEQYIILGINEIKKIKRHLKRLSTNSINDTVTDRKHDRKLDIKYKRSVKIYNDSVSVYLTQISTGEYAEIRRGNEIYYLINFRNRDIRFHYHCYRGCSWNMKVRYPQKWWNKTDIK